MARIITKELAQKIVRKLKARAINSSSKAHDEYVVEERGILIGVISIRRGSEKDKGHDYIPHDIRIRPSQAKLLAQCPWDRNRYIACLRENGDLPPAEGEEAEDNGAQGEPPG